ncbi:DUF459 domain-containing protein [Bartonella choladocola]|uniref:SGNH hydrolase-type esterase domain-containing protein n=1 Tax=Bartonella choladocola TaxID=2750995 RepID=A0A1U9MFJ3_9HYPH|nr:SGNH family hydrolase [Bartonella choladocola]AQT46717.1 hypothetical protein BBC0122_005880 [Bartonella choladocola]
MKNILRIAILILPVSILAFAPSNADARNLFDIIFGRKQQTQPDYPPPPPPVKKKRIIKAPVPQKTNQKAPDAKRILVLGDFVGNAVADGLNQFYAENPKVVILASTNLSSGLVNESHYNWLDNIGKLVTKEKPDIIVMALGANDNQPIKTGEKTINVEDKEWSDNYRQRIVSLSGALKGTGKPFFWLGNPSFKDPQLSQTISSLNRLYKQQMEAAGGHFVDVWEGFIDEQGKFALSGYDVNGKTVRLRANDGINFTSAGKKKLAFYLEKPLENLISLNGDNEGDKVKVDPNGPVISILPRDVDRVAPIGFYDMAGQNNGLLGDTETPKPDKAEDHWKPKNGKEAGRADNFSSVQ